ncbi:hypothetical protein CTEN210_14374 [Chaetoceros tenuissimus]|uniref:Uncharacterized protein n=1 Tax=Chaetoceros tenuissimus TaxID=426638 RepID=A0AAD3D532_9STRA|nr:hypothetical protein CTEN210_14374 [Chaetoceros tenuissimus]
MFLPDNMKNTTEETNADNLRKKAYTNIEKWSMEIIPESIRKGVEIYAQEVQCFDPECAPIDTKIAILFSAGGRGMMGLPLAAHEVTKEILKDNFPYGEVLEKWAKGEDAEWPPMDIDEDDQLPELRFDVGDKVECRVGADEATGWAKGEVIQLWYREKQWPEDTFAPYKVKLDNGKQIFAPLDVDQVIRATK